MKTKFLKRITKFIIVLSSVDLIINALKNPPKSSLIEVKPVSLNSFKVILKAPNSLLPV
jgi:hypothetical protein